MKILIIEPYFTGSHKAWLKSFKKNSSHSIKLITMKGQFWKWRMHGGAITLAKEFNSINYLPDLIIATDMLDLPNFVSLTRKKISGIPIVLYFHENQITYPWTKEDRDHLKNRDKHYGFINYASALSADYILFNSKFHMDSFLIELPKFLKQFPDYNEIETVETIKSKSHVLYLGMDLSALNKVKIEKEKNDNPIILWNHRWEYDKNPELFFSILKTVNSNDIKFSLVIIGENFSKSPSVFNEAKIIFKEKIIKWGYVRSKKEYAKWLWKADIIPVTSNQEFFGASVMEAIYCNTWPILPNRLTYPELIPQNLHNSHLYNNKDELTKKLMWALYNISTVRKRKLRFISQPYDWKSMAPVYDKTMDKIRKNYKSF